MNPITPIVEGKAVPDFTAESTQGEFCLSELRGKQHLVLYFYPKDNTPGCTTESQDFRDAYKDFQAADTLIVGVSRDSIKSHTGFVERQALPFPLVADPDETLCTLFDVIRTKNRYGKQVRGIERSTFLIDPEGKLAQEWRGVRVPGHVQAVLETLRETLKNAPSGSAD